LFHALSIIDTIVLDKPPFVDAMRRAPPPPSATRVTEKIINAWNPTTAA
jgi:hypothetical protein